MTDKTTRPVTLLIAALGGEGGGVLTNWTVGAAHIAGLPVQATSIPGVAQRTGATTYYIEIWPEPVTGDRRPVLSLSPAPGEVDIVATTELLEAGRCIMGGFVSPDRTLLIASTSRVYTTHEKMAVGDGRFDKESLVAAARAQSRKLHLPDLDSLAGGGGSRTNAVLLGLLAGSGELPLPVQAFEDAIRDGAKAVEANLAGFRAGLLDEQPETPVITPMDQGSILAEAETRLTAYQDKAYADQYRERLKAVTDVSLAGEVAKGLARRMAYQDIIAVAMLKVRPGRVVELADGTADDDVVHITEYFRPGLREICDILPVFIAHPLLGWAQAKPKRLRLSWPLALRSTTLTGFLALKFLAALRLLRRFSYRFQAEQAAIDAWLADIIKAAQTDPALAMEITKNAQVIKGYGDTLSRGRAAFDALRGETDAQSMAAARAKALSDRPA